jgi:ketosteroid isomerase-like protein
MNRTKRFLLEALLLSSALVGKEFSAGQTAQQDFARQLVDRQARAWEKQDFTLAAADWLPTAELISPEGKVPAGEMPNSMKDYFKQFRDLRITVKNVFVSSDGKKLAIEWDWAVARKRDGKRGTSHDAIIVDLTGGKIASWREYYDPASSVEANP